MFAHINPHHEIGVRCSKDRMQTSRFLPLPGHEPEKDRNTADAGSTKHKSGHHPCVSRVSHRISTAGRVTFSLLKRLVPMRVESKQMKKVSI